MSSASGRSLFGEGLGVLLFILIGLSVLCALIFGAAQLIIDIAVCTFHWWDVPLGLFYGYLLCAALGAQSRHQL